MVLRWIWVLMAGIVVAVSAQANGDYKRNIVFMDPAGLVFGAAAIEYERIIDSSWGVGIAVSSNIFWNGKIHDTEWDEDVLKLAYKFYHGNNALKGWHGELAVVYTRGDYYSTADFGGRIVPTQIIGRKQVSVVAIAEYRFRLLSHLIAGTGLGYGLPVVLDDGEGTGHVDVYPLGGLVVNLRVGVAFAF